MKDINAVTGYIRGCCTALGMKKEYPTIHTADALGMPQENCCKTLVLQGKSKGYSVFVLPIEEELNLKECAKAVNEKSVEMIHVKDINAVTRSVERRGGEEGRYKG